jgi:hypothetical protein
MNEIFYASETRRFVLKLDEGNHWQLEDFVRDDVGFVEFGREFRDYDFDRGEFRSELRELIERIHDRARQKKAVRLYLRMAGVPFIEYRVVGYSQGELRDVIVYGRDFDEASLRVEGETLKEWLYGGIYGLFDERLEAWQNVETAELEYQWREADCYSGYVFVGGYTPEKAILDTFGITIGDVA